MKYDGESDKVATLGSLAWKIMERFFSQGVALLVQIILARLLVPDDFGALAIIVAITNYAAIIVQSGLATFLIQKKNLEKNDISTALISSLFVALVLYVILFVLSPFLSFFFALPELKWALRVLALLLFLNSINAIQTAVLSRKMNFRKLFFRSVIAVPFSGAIGIVMACCGCGIWALVVHQLSNMLLVILIMSFDRDLRIPLAFSWSRMTSMYSYSWKILVTNMVTGFHDSLRTIIIGKEYDTDNLAYYDKAYTYSSYVTLIINSSLSSVLLPVFSRQQDEIEKLRYMARRASRLSAFVMFPVLLFVLATSNVLVNVVLTNRWSSSVPYLMVFCLLRLPGAITTADKQVYYAIGKSGISLWYEIGLFALNLTALMVALPNGTMAIAIGATVVEWIGCISIWCVSSKIYGYKFYDRLRDTIVPAINASIMAMTVWIVGRYLSLNSILELIIQTILGLVIYFVLSKLMRDESLSYCLNILRDFMKHYDKKGEYKND